MNLAHTGVMQVQKTCDTGVDKDIASLQAHMKACERAEWLARLSIWMAGPCDLMKQRVVSSVAMAVVAGLLVGAIAAIFLSSVDTFRYGTKKKPSARAGPKSLTTNHRKGLATRVHTRPAFGK